MKRIIGIAGAVLVVAVAGGAIWWFGQGNEAPTVGATAPPLETTSTMPTGTTAPSDPASVAVAYQLADETTATFTLTEELRGTPKTVTGVSGIVLGEVVVDPAHPRSLRMGTVLVNARDFTTDSGNRNRAIRGPILAADTFEDIEFSPTSIDGLPDGPADDLSFTVTGDLTIRDVTNPVTFEVTLSADDPTRIVGTAVATVDRTDWGLNIPSAPGVANVAEEVRLTLDIVAVPTG